jgi:hypothetical protein
LRRLALYALAHNASDVLHFDGKCIGFVVVFFWDQVTVPFAWGNGVGGHLNDYEIGFAPK